mgnify:CR=1 FL=1
MHSSTSSSDSRRRANVYDRALPQRDLALSVIVAVVVTFVLMAAWEAYWHSHDAVPSYRNSAGLWAIQRRRINAGEGDSTVLVGSSRMFFNTQLDVWEQESGERPIQLALEGTSPVSLMEELAADTDFTGTLVVGVAPGLFFSGFEYRAKVFDYYRDESPSQWLGQKISMLFEPYLAFYHYDYSLFTVLKRQPLPAREGVRIESDVRRLATHEADRATKMFAKVETDLAYAEIAKQIWAENFVPIEERDEEWLTGAHENRGKQIDRAVEATRKLQDRGIEVIFVRNPAEGHYAVSEPMYNPREETWDVLIERTGALGIHWQDHPELQDYWLPEWSHLSRDEARRFTRALYQVIQRERAVRAEAEGTDVT